LNFRVLKITFSRSVLTKLVWDKEKWVVFDGLAANAPEAELDSKTSPRFRINMLYRECPDQENRVYRLALTLILSLLLIACGHSADKFVARGEEYLQKRKFHDAMMQFRAAAESDRDSAKAHWGLARAYENLGRFNETIDELRKTVELDENNLDAKARLGNYFLLVQPPLIPETEKIQEEIIAKDPNFVEGRILKASILATQNRPENEVVAKIDEAIAIDPKRTETHLSLSRYYMTHEKAAEAEAAITKGISMNPNAALGMIEYGRFLMYANRPSEAESQFDLAIAAEPANIEAYESKADFLASTRQLDKAEAAYEKLVEIQDNSPESRLELAEFYMTAQRQSEAIATLEQILADAPEYVRARYRLGEIYLTRKETDKVSEQLAVLFKINDDDAEALMLRARLRMAENRSNEAVIDLENVLKKQPSERDALFYISQVKLSLGQIDQARAFIADLERYHPSFLKVGLLKIQTAMAIGDTPEALKQASELYAKTGAATPNAETNAQALQELQVRSLTARGLAYLDLGRLVEAKADLNEVVKRSPNSSAAIVNLARVFVAEKNTSGAIGLFNTALAMDASNFDALSGYVNVSLSVKQPKQAHSKVDETIGRNAGRGDVLAALHYLKSTIFSSDNDKASAESELKQSIELDGDYLPAYSAYASLLAARNETAAAIEQYQKVVQMSPSAPVYTLLGILEDARGSVAAAEQNYRRALEIAQDSPVAANNLAWLIAENQGNLDEALQLATFSASRNQSVAAYYDTLGYIYLKKGLYSPAIEQLRKAVTLDEKNGNGANPGYRVRLATALASAGNKVAARREVENSLRSQNLLSQKEMSEAKSVLASL
jgi:tetratricopeptide (TPR) repeat protein